MIELLRKKPLSKIQIKEIVQVADVSRPTFYNHFETKEDLLFSHMDDLFEKIHKVVFDGVNEKDTVDLRMLLISSYEQWLHHSESLKWVMQVENKDVLIELSRTHIEGLIQEYEKYVSSNQSSVRNREYAISFISGGTYMLLRDWLDRDMQESPEQMGQLTYRLLTQGLTQFQAEITHDDI